MTRLEFFYDLTSPWTYLAFTGIQPLAERYGVLPEWRPILVGGVFNEVNQELYAQREAFFGNRRRMTYLMKDLRDWADLRGIEINWPDFHPVNAVKCMRGCFVAEEEGKLLEYSRAVFEAYWGRCEEVGDEPVLAAIVEALAMDSAAFLARLADQDVKDQLRANTDELIARGGFGSPTVYINGDDMYFGNDRLPVIESKLASLAES
ncbi:MAG: 2-hydroxychromene-2-carboxylate isomerase [Halieaceae bacterium]